MNARLTVRPLMPALLAVVLGLFAPPASGSEAALHDFDRDSLNTLRESHQGRPFVLALWSVHCEPCRSELALLGPFKADHPEIAVELVAADYRDDRPAVQAMLAEFDLDGVRTWAFADDFVERIRFAIDPEWRGELPRIYLFDGSHRATAISGRIEAETLADWRRSLTDVRND